MEKRRVLLGITGSIACYKACDVLRILIKEGFEVDVVLSKGALEFLSPSLFSALLRKKVYTDEDFFSLSHRILHIELANSPDLIAIIPSSANFIAKAASGQADTLVSAILLATRKPVIFFPSMNTKMYEHPATRKNLNQLREFGYFVYEPVSGALACGEEGKGRLPDPTTCCEAIKALFTKKDLKGKKVLITGGATKEYLDEVRYITNGSSGKMALSLAREAYYRGAEVFLILGETRVHINFPDLGFLGIPAPGIKRINSTEEMLEECEKLFDTVDIVVFAAAPVDFKPKTKFKGKIKKDSFTGIEFEKTPDIAKTLGQKKASQLIVGFALEEESKLEEYARKKPKDKNFDIVIANPISTVGKEKSSFLIVDKEKSQLLENITKSQLARLLFDFLGSYVQSGSSSR